MSEPLLMWYGEELVEVNEVQIALNGDVEAEITNYDGYSTWVLADDLREVEA